MKMREIITKLKMILIIILAILPAVQCKADCISDCQKVISAADRLIKDLKDEINVRKKLEEAQYNQVVNLTLQNDEKAEQLSSALRNPFITIGAGILAVAILVLVD